MILVASTVAPYKMDGVEELRWLRHAEALRDASPEPLAFFAALERGPARLMSRYEPLLGRLMGLASSDHWWFEIDDGERELTSGNRIHRICAGRNLVHEKALRAGASHVLFLDTDLEAPADSIARLLEVDWPVAGGHVPSYCLAGEPVLAHPQTGEPFAFPVERHMNTAGFMLISQEVVRSVRWRWDPVAGLTDDPCFAEDCERLGWPTLVRKDLIGEHPPLVPMEMRGHDRSLA